LGQKLAEVQEQAYREKIKTISDVESFKENTKILQEARK